MINSGRFSPPPLITRTLLLYFVPFHKFGGKNSEFPLLRCSSPFGWRLRWREIGAGHFRRPLIRNFHQGVIRRHGGGVAEHLVRIGEGRKRERGFRSSGGRIREGRSERESAVQSPRGSGKPWAPILSRNLSLTAAADDQRMNARDAMDPEMIRPRPGAKWFLKMCQKHGEAWFPSLKNEWM